MRRALVVLVALALLVAPAAADEDLPRHFLSDASLAGDWSTLEATLTIEPADDPAAAALPRRLLVTYRVKSVWGEVFEVATETLTSQDAESSTRRFPKSSKRLRDLLGVSDEASITDVMVSSEERKVAGRAFPCSKITFVTTEGKLVQQNELWIAPEMRSLRICALSTRVISSAGGPRVSLDMEVRGYGTADETLWGKTASELAKGP